ncbi:MAG: ribonuclease III [Deferribacteres bacterium]|nr:ribonuclease III [candidate division KSB1 bacterium]MCB9500571.1 ribonuclease III [Deferribacteres bacterium]
MFDWLTNLFKNTSKRKEAIFEVDHSSLEKLFNYSFLNKRLIEQALKHRSILPTLQESRVESNERLELLGDSVLGLIVTDFLYSKFPEKEEGELTEMKSVLVSRKILAKVANSLKLGDYLMLSDAEVRSGGKTRISIVADAMEAVIGAMYLDGGLTIAQQFVMDNILRDFENMISEEQHKNFKSILLEYAQGNNLGSPTYVVRDEDGPDHKKIFTVEVIIQHKIAGVGKGKSKKHAEQNAAKDAIEKMLI